MGVHANVSAVIKAAPEVVWPWVADLNRHGEWSPKPYRVEKVTGEWNRVGSTYRSVGFVPPKDPEHGNLVTITDVQPVTRFALDATDENGVFHNVYTLRPTDSGTEVTFDITFPDMKGMAGVMLPILFPLVGKPTLKKRMDMLKAKVEASPAS